MLNQTESHNEIVDRLIEIIVRQRIMIADQRESLERQAIEIDSLANRLIQSENTNSDMGQLNDDTCCCSDCVNDPAPFSFRCPEMAVVDEDYLDEDEDPVSKG